MTSNRSKFRTARKYLAKHGIALYEVNQAVSEIQSDSISTIALAKAELAYRLLGVPLIVSDHGWAIKALGGFPGPFMKYINMWFKPDDLLKLLEDQEDREVKRIEVICYKDEARTELFLQELTGTVLREPRGQSLPAMCVISLVDSNKSVAECWAKGIGIPDENKIWDDFAAWYKNIHESAEKC